MNWKFWSSAEPEEKMTASAVLALVTSIKAEIHSLRFEIAKGIDVGSSTSFHDLGAEIAQEMDEFKKLLERGIDITSISAFRRLEVAVDRLKRREAADKRRAAR